MTTHRAITLIRVIAIRLSTRGGVLALG